MLGTRSSSPPAGSTEQRCKAPVLTAATAETGAHSCCEGLHRAFSWGMDICLEKIIYEAACWVGALRAAQGVLRHCLGYEADVATSMIALR